MFLSHSKIAYYNYELASTIVSLAASPVRSHSSFLCPHTHAPITLPLLRTHGVIIINYVYACTVTVNCFLPEEPSNRTIVNYERLNVTVLEGTVLTYQCDNGLSLTGPNTITCTNAGAWSTEPEAIKCVSPTEGESIINPRHVGNHRGYGNPLVCLPVCILSMLTCIWLP